MTRYKLEKKNRLHYRPGSTNTSRNCEHCKYFIDNVTYSGGEPVARCSVMGLSQAPMYNVRPDYTCNAQVMDTDSLSEYVINIVAPEMSQATKEDTAGANARGDGPKDRPRMIQYV